MVVRNPDLFSSALTTKVERPMYNTVVSACGGASFCNRAGHTHYAVIFGIVTLSLIILHMIYLVDYAEHYFSKIPDIDFKSFYLCTIAIDLNQFQTL